MITARAGHIPARGAEGFWRLEKTEQPSLVYCLSHVRPLKFSFSWLQKISLEQPAVHSTNLAYVSETPFTCAHINLEVRMNL